MPVAGVEIRFHVRESNLIHVSLDVAKIMIHARRVFIDSRKLFYVNQIWNSSSKCNISLLPGNLVISGP